MNGTGVFHQDESTRYSFSEGCRIALLAARLAAVGRREESVSTAHMVTGLLECRDDVVIAMLAAAKIDATPAAPRKLAGVVPELPFNRKAKRAMELAMVAAVETEQSTVLPGHLLLGVLREGGVGAKVLQAAGATEELFVAVLTKSLA
jgi:ATP-dependent Clp protease ATP-binding subunit ClpA